MLKLTPKQREIIIKANQEAEKLFNNHLLEFTQPPQPHLKLFNSIFPKNVILKGLANEYYSKNKKIIDLSDPKVEHDLALKLSLYKAPESFKHFSDQDIIEYINLYKSEYEKTKTTNFNFTAFSPLSLKSNQNKQSSTFFSKVAQEGLKKAFENYDFFQPDNMDAGIYKKLGLTERDVSVSLHMHNTLTNSNTLTSEAWQQFDIDLGIFNLKNSEKIKAQVEINAKLEKENEDKRNKNFEEQKHELKKLGIDINNIRFENIVHFQDLRSSTEQLKNKAEQAESDHKDILNHLKNQQYHNQQTEKTLDDLLQSAMENEQGQKFIIANIIAMREIQSEALAKMAAQAKQEEIKSYFNAATEVGNLLVQIGQMTGSRDLQKFAAVAAASTQAFYAACQITGSLGVTAVSGIAMINPITAMISGALAVVSILSSDDEDNEALAEMFNQLFNALNIIHKEMHEQFDLVHRELFEVFKTVHESMKQNQLNFIKVNDKLDAIAKFQQFVYKEVIDASHATHLSETNKVIFEIKEGDLPESLDGKLDHLKTLKYAGNALAFNNVFNNPDKNSALLFTDKSIEQQLENRPLEQNVGFLVNYANNTLGIKDLSTAKAMPNPSLFFSVVSVLPNLVLDIVNQNASKAEPMLKTLEPIIATHKKLINTLEALKSQNVVGKMLKVYNSEITSFGNYIAKQNEEYSSAYNLPKALNYTLPVISNAYKENKVETNSMVVNTRTIVGLIEQGDIPKVWKVSSLYDDTGCSLCIEGPYIMAEKIGLGNNYLECIMVRDIKSLAYESKGKYTDKATGAQIPITCPPDQRVVDAVATKLQSIRGDFIDKLNAEPEFKEHINKLKIYEKMIFFYSALTGDAMVVSYAQAFENYLATAKMISAQDVLIISPSEYYTQQNVWFSDNSTITQAHNKWQASNSTYLEVAKSLGQALNFTSTLLKQVKEFDDMPKTTVTKENPQAIKAFKVLKSYFSNIADSKDELVSEFPKSKVKQFEKFTKFYDAASIQIEEINSSPTPEQLEELYCNVYCTDRTLRFNVKWYREAISQDETLIHLNNEMKEFTDKIIICEC